MVPRSSWLTGGVSDSLKLARSPSPTAVSGMRTVMVPSMGIDASISAMLPTCADDFPPSLMVNSPIAAGVGLAGVLTLYRPTTTAPDLAKCKSSAFALPDKSPETANSRKLVSLPSWVNVYWVAFQIHIDALPPVIHHSQRGLLCWV